jgi:hypothetical protein
MLKMETGQHPLMQYSYNRHTIISYFKIYQMLALAIEFRAYSNIVIQTRLRG